MIFIRKKGQVSIEYLLILALALAIIVPGSMMLIDYSKETNEKLIESQINKIGMTIINNAEEVYSIGSYSWVTTEFSFPENVKDIYVDVNNNTLVIEYSTPRGITEAVFFTDIQLNGAHPGNRPVAQVEPGYVKIKIESRGNYVLLTQRTN